MPDFSKEKYLDIQFIIDPSGLTILLPIVTTGSTLDITPAIIFGPLAELRTNILDRCKLDILLNNNDDFIKRTGLPVLQYYYNSPSKTTLNVMFYFDEEHSTKYGTGNIFENVYVQKLKTSKYYPDAAPLKRFKLLIYPTRVCVGKINLYGKFSSKLSPESNITLTDYFAYDEAIATVDYILRTFRYLESLVGNGVWLSIKMISGRGYGSALDMVDKEAFRRSTGLSQHEIFKRFTEENADEYRRNGLEIIAVDKIKYIVGNPKKDYESLIVVPHTMRIRK